MLIVKWTNLKMREANKKTTTLAEILARLGIHVLMKLIKQANYQTTRPTQDFATT